MVWPRALIGTVTFSPTVRSSTPSTPRNQRGSTTSPKERCATTRLAICKRPKPCTDVVGDGTARTPRLVPVRNGAHEFDAASRLLQRSSRTVTICGRSRSRSRCRDPTPSPRHPKIKAPRQMTQLSCSAIGPATTVGTVSDPSRTQARSPTHYRGNRIIRRAFVSTIFSTSSSGTCASISATRLRLFGQFESECG